MGPVLTLLAVVVAMAGCGGGERGLDDTLPTIAPVATTSSTSTTSTTGAIPITAAATAVATTATTAPPTTAATTVAAAPPAAGASTTTAVATTTTLPAITPTLTALACTGAQLGADTGGTHAEPACLAGWAVEQPPCTGPCETALVYHATGDGWVADGEHNRACAAPLVEVGMPPAVAETFAVAPCPGDPTGGAVVHRGDTGDPVIGVQVALVNRGYDVAVDGRFGPATEAAVRHFQSGAGLDSDGRVGPDTQTALFAP